LAGKSKGPGGETYIAMSRCSADGVPDSTFDTEGKVLKQFVLHDFANRIALQADGQIVLVGQRGTSNGWSTQAPSAYRFHADGTPDSTFYLDGQRPFNYGAAPSTTPGAAP